MASYTTSMRAWIALSIVIALAVHPLATSTFAQGSLKVRTERERSLMSRRIAVESTEQEQAEYYNGHRVAPGSALVKVSTPSGTVGADVLTVADADVNSITRLGESKVTVVRSYSEDATTLISKLRQLPNVIYAEPDYIVNAYDTIVPPTFQDQWALQNTGQKLVDGTEGISGADVGAVSAWTVTRGTKSVVIGITDSGVDYTHPDLVDNMWSAPDAFTVVIEGKSITCPKGSHGFNAIAKTCDPMDDNNHGTHVAGILGANGASGSGILGVNQTTSIMALKFLDNRGTGRISDAINAIEFAVQAKQKFGSGANVRILNNSWGGGGKSDALLDEINRAADNELLFVAAAGNDSADNDASPHFPASYAAPNVIAVAATTNRDLLAVSFSDWGKNSVHLGAPGAAILSTIATTSGQKYAYFSGTSMATPFVSGAAALILSRCPLNTQGLKKQILVNVTPNPSLNDKTITGGRLDVNKALRACVSPSL